MKKPSRREHSSEATHANAKTLHSKGEGPWEFTNSGRLFSVGATDAVRRAAYRTATGEIRFLPL